MKSKKPKVSLISHTEHPLELMCYFRRVMHAPVPDSLYEMAQEPEKWLGMSIDDYVEKVLAKDRMPTFLESVQFTFKLEHVSRALTHQLVRHRVGFSYSQQSQRCVRMETFAGDGNYHCPETADPKLYHPLMVGVQEAYNAALENGCTTQDARGLLPTNIQTTILFSCTLRALIGMLNKRLCQKTQGEFRSVAHQIMDLLNEVDLRITEYWVGAPCKFGKCMMESENEMQYQQGLLEGQQNTDHVCPIYVCKFKKDKNGL